MIYDYPYHRNYLRHKYNLYNNTNYINRSNIKNDYHSNFDEINKKDFQDANTTDYFNTLNNKDKRNSNDTILNILGIELCIDDLIILGVLYLLYTEGVKDIGLYIVLILLLIN